MVAEDIKKDGSFKQTKGELMCTVSNLAFIKHYYPDFHTILFVDKFTKTYFESFGITELFDEVNDTLLDQDVDIDKEVFWAAGKLMAQRITPGPTLTMDLDFWVLSDISMMGVFDSDITCLWIEELDNKFYHKPEDALKDSNLNLTYDWDNYSINVSFLFIKDEEFKNLYCDLAIEYMKSMYQKVPKNISFEENTKFILFAEQYLLNQLARKFNKKVKVLVDDFYDITNLKHVESIGVHMETCPNYIYHMGNHKHDYREKNNFAKEGIERFYNKTTSVITDTKFIKVINEIYKKSEYERCFC